MHYYIIYDIGNTEKLIFKTYFEVFDEYQRLQGSIWAVFMVKKDRQKSKY